MLTQKFKFKRLAIGWLYLYLADLPLEQILRCIAIDRRSTARIIVIIIIIIFFFFAELYYYYYYYLMDTMLH